MKIFLKQLANINYGKIKVILPDNKIYKFSGSKKGPKVNLKINSYKAIQRILSDGSLGFAESYLDGGVETQDLKKLFIFSLKNEKNLNFIFRKSFLSKIFNKLIKKIRENSLRQNKKNISYHYDLGNEFFKHWLDKNLTYSSAIYKNKKESLEIAQKNKFEKICKLLQLNSKHHLLEIGCGWGGFATYVVKKYHCRITCITLSKKQYAYVEKKIKKLGMEDKINLKFADYRNLTGEYDRIASIEMFEAVGEKYWDLYFKKIKQLLKPNGIAAFQIIALNNERFLRYKKNLDFIQKHIFPGGMLPSKQILKKIIIQNNFSLISCQTYAKHYARTLKNWFVRFKKSWPAIKNLGFNEKFKRKWEYYLNYCEIGFELGTLDLMQIRIKKKK